MERWAGQVLPRSLLCPQEGTEHAALGSQRPQMPGHGSGHTTLPPAGEGGKAWGWPDGGAGGIHTEQGRCDPKLAPGRPVSYACHERGPSLASTLAFPVTVHGSCGAGCVLGPAAWDSLPVGQRG